MSNSRLVDYTDITSHKTSPRKDKIRKITIHHMAGNLSVEECGEVFHNRDASTNYGIGNDGRIGLYVDECYRAWATTDPDNDHQAINIELANDEIGGNWHVSDKVINRCIDLCVDICKRNGIEKLNFTGDESGNLTMHCYFMATACPGSYLKTKFKYIADKVNERLGSTPIPKPNGDMWAGAYPSLPERGYYLTGDGYNTYVGYQNDIKLIQQYLNWAINTKLEVDGYYGNATTNAVESFQRKVGLTADGSYGKDTLSAAKKYKKNSASKKYSGALPTKDLVPGSVGSQVKELQNFLNWYGNYGLEIDGSYGNLTTSAVKNFQTSEKILIDGMFGIQSRTTAKKYT